MTAGLKETVGVTLLILYLRWLFKTQSRAILDLHLRLLSWTSLVQKWGKKSSYTSSTYINKIFISLKNCIKIFLKTPPPKFFIYCNTRSTSSWWPSIVSLCNTDSYGPWRSTSIWAKKISTHRGGVCYHDEWHTHSVWCKVWQNSTTRIERLPLHVGKFKLALLRKT